MSLKPKLMWALIAGLALATACDDDADGGGTDATGSPSDAAVRADADAAGGAGGDLGIGGEGGGLGPDAGGESACTQAVARILGCGVDEAACPAWGPGGPSREEVEAGLIMGCAETPALGTLTNAHMGDCASLIETLSGASADFAAACNGPAPIDPDLSNPLAIEAWLDGKTAVMTGADIPEWPLGYFEGANYGEATQCLAEVKLRYVDVSFISDTDFGTLNGAPDEGSVGTCDHMPSSRQAQATTRGYAIEGDGVCFDLRLDFGSYTLEGRGDFTPDGRTMRLELYYAGQATGTTCLDGAVGSAGVQVSDMDLGGDAVQVYRLRD